MTNSPRSYKYWAFISYSTRDKRWGKWLGNKLETYRIPDRLRDQKENQDIPTRLRPVFLDRWELAASSDIGETIRHGLEQSRYLIVVCSPRSAQSKWVSEEVRAFKAMGRAGNILALIVDGEPNADPSGRVEECYPPVLRFETDENGDLTEEAAKSEPLAGDARPQGDGKKDALLKIVAGMIGVGFDRLKRRDESRRRKRAIYISAGSIVLAVVFAAIAVRAYLSEQTARSRLSESFAKRGEEQVDSGKPASALPFFVEALAAEPKDPRSTKVHRVRLASWTGLAPETIIFPDEKSTSGFSFGPKGAYVVSVDGTKVHQWNSHTGEHVEALPLKIEYPLSVSFSKDRSRIVTSHTNGKVCIYDVLTGSRTLLSPGHQEAVNHACFDTTTKLVATASRDKTARIWKVSDGTPVTKPLRHQGEVLYVAFNNDGRRLVTASDDGTAVIWNVKNGEALKDPFSHDGQRMLMADFSPTQPLIATAGIDGTARIWNSETGKQIQVPVKTCTSVEVVRFSPDGEYLVIGDSAGKCHIWNVADESLVGEPIKHEDTIANVRFDSSGRWFAIAGAETCGVYVTATGKPITSSLSNGGSTLRWQTLWDVRFDGTGTRLISAGKEGLLRIWPIHPYTARVLGPPGTIGSFSGDGSHACVFEPSGSVQVLDLSKSNSESMPLPELKEVTRAILDYSGTCIAVACADKTIRVCNVRSQKLLCELPTGYQTPIQSMSMSRNGRYLTTVSEASITKVWDLIEKRAIGETIEFQMAVSASTTSDGGKVIIYGSDGFDQGHVAICRIAEGPESLKVLGERRDVLCMEVGPHERQIVTGHRLDRTARLWDPDTCKELIKPLKHEAELMSVSISPDGSRIATSSTTWHVRTWSIDSHSPLTPRIGRADEQYGVAQISNDNLLLVAGATDGTVRVFDASMGTEAMRPLELGPGIASARFSADGKRIVIVSDDGRPYVWPVAPDSRPIDTLRLWAEVASGMQVDDSGGLVELSRKDVKERWHEYLKLRADQ